MSIIAKNNGGAPRELIAAGNYIARCYKMIQIGTVKELILGEEKILHKVRIGWELPTEMRVFKEEFGEQPMSIDKEYTLSMHEKSALRRDLKSWRGKDFTDKEAEAFDITKLIGVPCMINIVHKPSKKDPSRFYEEIAGITPLPKGVECPSQINLSFELSFDNWNSVKFDSLPDFIKTKITSSQEYKEMQNPHTKDIHSQDAADDLPF